MVNIHGIGFHVTLMSDCQLLDFTRQENFDDIENVVIKVLLPCEVQQLTIIMYTAVTCLSTNT